MISLRERFSAALMAWRNPEAVRPPLPVSTWAHARRGGLYGVLGTVTVQASTGPLLDDEQVWLYDGEAGRLFVRRAPEFLDGRFTPVNDLAVERAAQAAPEKPRQEIYSVHITRLQRVDSLLNEAKRWATSDRMEGVLLEAIVILRGLVYPVGDAPTEPWTPDSARDGLRAYGEEGE